MGFHILTYIRIRYDMKNDQYLRSIKILYTYTFVQSFKGTKKISSLVFFYLGTSGSNTDLATIEKTFQTHLQWYT